MTLQYLDRKTGKVIEFFQEFVYENLPLYCECQGHDEGSCRFIVKKDRNHSLEESDPIGEELITGEKFQGDLQQILNEKKGIVDDEQETDGTRPATSTQLQVVVPEKNPNTTIPIDRALTKILQDVAIGLQDSSDPDEGAGILAVDAVDVRLIEETQDRVVAVANEGLHGTSDGLVSSGDGLVSNTQDQLAIVVMGYTSATNCVLAVAEASGHLTDLQCVNKDKTSIVEPCVQNFTIVQNLGHSSNKSNKQRLSVIPIRIPCHNEFEALAQSHDQQIVEATGHMNQAITTHIGASHQPSVALNTFVQEIPSQTHKESSSFAAKGTCTGKNINAEEGKNVENSLQQAVNVAEEISPSIGQDKLLKMTQSTSSRVDLVEEEADNIGLHTNQVNTNTKSPGVCSNLNSKAPSFVPGQVKTPTSNKLHQINDKNDVNSAIKPPKNVACDLVHDCPDVSSCGGNALISSHDRELLDRLMNIENFQVVSATKAVQVNANANARKNVFPDTKFSNTLMSFDINKLIFLSPINTNTQLQIMENRSKQLEGSRTMSPKRFDNLQGDDKFE